jgi:hypothetical protein
MKILRALLVVSLLLIANPAQAALRAGARVVDATPTVLPTFLRARMKNPLLYFPRNARHSKIISKSPYAFTLARCGRPPPVRGMTPSFTH